MGKKISYYEYNLPCMIDLCNELGFKIYMIDESSYQYRVFGSTHVIDFWLSRMVYHRISGETIKSNEEYNHNLDYKFNKNQVSKLLLTGDL